MEFIYFRGKRLLRVEVILYRWESFFLVKIILFNEDPVLRETLSFLEMFFFESAYLFLENSVFCGNHWK